MNTNGWSVFNTSNVSSSNTILYTGITTSGGTYPAWSPSAPKVKTPLEWLHGEVEAICRLGRLDD